MGILFVASGLMLPSHLWMRRMLDNLADAVVAVADRSEVGSPYSARWPFIPLRDDPASRWRPLLRRVHLERLLTPPRSAVKALRDAVASPSVSTVLVQFLDVAVRY